MIAGTDRYFQIVKCFRDEDLRADRQPEFTQIDVEMSFATRELVFATIEPLIREVFAVDRPGDHACRSRACPTPRRSRSYGSDKPDLRVGMAIADVSRVVRRVDVQRLPGGGRRRRGRARHRRARRRGALAQGTRHAGRRGEGARRRRPRLGAPERRRRAEFGAQGGGRGRASRAALDAAGAGAADLLLLACGPADATSKVLGQLRLSVARRRGWLKPDEFAFTWVDRLPAARVGRGRAALGGHAPPVHVARRGGHGPARGATPAACSRRPTTSCSTAARSAAAASVSTTRRCSGGCSALLGISDEDAKLRFGFFLEVARVRHAAARRHRPRPRPHRRDPGRRAVDPRRHRVPEDRAGRGPDVDGALAGRRAAAARAAPPHRGLTDGHEGGRRGDAHASPCPTRASRPCSARTTRTSGSSSRSTGVRVSTQGHDLLVTGDAAAVARVEQLVGAPAGAAAGRVPPHERRREDGRGAAGRRTRRPTCATSS